MSIETIIKIFLYGFTLGRNTGKDEVEALEDLKDLIAASKKEVDQKYE